MDDQNQFAASAGQSGGTQDNNAGQQGSAGNPFAAAGDQATPATNAGVTDTPPWLNFNPTEGSAAPEASASTPVENTFDPFSNPFDGSAGASAPAPEVAAQPVPQMTEPASGGSAAGGDDDAMNLLVKLQQQFEYEEHDFQETLQMHEENIKAEQEAIRELRQKRKERMEDMKKIILGLEKLVGLTQDKQETPKSASTSKPAKKTEPQSAKKVDNDDFFSAA